MDGELHITQPTQKAKHHRRKARAHGEGSVCKEASSGKWMAVISVGYADGRRRRKKLRFDTQQEARQALTRLQKAVDDGLGVGDDRITVKQFLERWQAECVDGPMSSLRPSTRASYAFNIKNHLIPGIGHYTLAKLSPMHVQAFLSAKLVAVDDSGAPVLAPRTVQYLHAILRSALKSAERWNLVSRNVAKLVDPPSPSRHEAKSLTTQQVGQLLKVVEHDRLRALFILALALGLRRGELLGLRWEHVDLDAGVVRVRQQLQRQTGKGLVVSELKTERSRRSLRLPGVAVRELRDHRRRQLEERLAAGEWTDSGYVFTTLSGAPLDGQNVLKRWKKALVEAGIPDMPFHSSRHTAASFLLAQGADLRTVMGVLGHSQIAMTANTYAHVLEELSNDAATKADAALAAARESADSR